MGVGIWGDGETGGLLIQNPKWYDVEIERAKPTLRERVGDRADRQSGSHARM